MTNIPSSSGKLSIWKPLIISSSIIRENVPHALSEIPDVFTDFRKSVEPLRSNGRMPIGTIPSTLPPAPNNVPPQSHPFWIPQTAEELIDVLQKPLFEKPDVSLFAFPDGSTYAHFFVEGSTAANERIVYSLPSGAGSAYKGTRNGLLGTDFSTKLRAYLAYGCISAG